MDDLNDINNGGLSGDFDSVEKNDNEQKEEKGYTVTPDGGFYTKPKEEIIQDELFNYPNQEEKEPEKAS